jgi:hypothetical protein
MKLKYSKRKFKMNGKKSNKRKKRIQNNNKKYKVIGGMKYMIYDGKTNVFKYIDTIN